MVSARRFKRAPILLLADEGHGDEIIAQMLYVGESTVHRTRQKFVDGGIEFALSEAPRSGVKRKLDGKMEIPITLHHCPCLDTARSMYQVNNKVGNKATSFQSMKLQTLAV